MESDPIDAFCARVVENVPTEDGKRLPCYIRLKTGTIKRTAAVASSGIAVGTDPARLAGELRERVEGLRGSGDARAWIEVVVRGETSPWDSVSVDLTPDPDDHEGATPGRSIAETKERAEAWSIVRLVDVIARNAESSAREAREANARSARLVERVAELRAEVQIASITAGAGEGGITRAIDALAPLLPVVAARMAGGSKAPATASEPAAPAPAADPVDELAAIVTDLGDDVKERLIRRLSGGGE